jgi:RNA polymerase sigma factor (sigma-70 family)
MPPSAEGIASRFVLGPALRTQPDRRLVSLVRDGYESAFEEIVRRYGKPLTRYAAAIVGGRSEDVTQDAFSKALLALRRDDAEIELRPWLFRIVRNTALNDLRDSPPSPEVLAEAIAGGPSAAEEAERRAELTDLIERLQALPEPQRAAIVMRELEGLSHEEIAAALGVTGGAARQAIHRARRALRDGAGMLVPLPLLKTMLAGAGPGAAEAATGAAGIGSAAGAGVALKATAATVLVAGAVGAGVALDDHHRDRDTGATPARESWRGSADTASAPAAATPNPGEDGGDRHGHGSDGEGHPGRGESGQGDDHGGHGKEGGNDHGGRGHEAGDNRGGGGAREDHGHGSSPGGGSSGSGGGSSGPGEDSGSSQSISSGRGKGPDPGGGDSGPGGGPGSGGSGSGGGPGPSGGGGPGPSEEPSGGGPGPSEPPPEDDGPGSGSGSNSGSGGGSRGGDDGGGGSG